MVTADRVVIDYYEIAYTPELAKRVREAVRSGSTEVLDIIK